MLSLKFEHQLTKQEFVKACMYMSTSTLSYKIKVGLGILYIMIGLILCFFITEVYEWTITLVGAIVIIATPAFAYFKAISCYKPDSRISETITYEFTDNNFIVTGQSFNTSSSINKLHKVTANKKWLLIWQTKGTANIIPMSIVTETEISELKEILITNNVKYKFR
jgi:hypothetical protein